MVSGVYYWFAEKTSSWRFDFALTIDYTAQLTVNLEPSAHNNEKTWLESIVDLAVNKK